MQAEVIERAFEPFFCYCCRVTSVLLQVMARLPVMGAITVTAEWEVVLPSPFCAGARTLMT